MIETPPPNPDDAWIGRRIAVKAAELRRKPGRSKYTSSAIRARLEGTIKEYNRVPFHPKDIYFLIALDPQWGEGEGWFHVADCQIL